MINMEIALLRTLVAAHDYGSYSAAAESVSRTPSAISMQMRKLEEIAGGPLLYREGGDLIATDRGQTLLDYARKILSLHDEALERASGLELSGRVRLGVSEDFAQGPLGPVLSQFRKAHPGVQIELTVDLTHSLLAALDRNHLDVVVARKREDVPGRKSVELMRSPLVWVSAPGVSGYDGDRLELVVFPDGAYPRQELFTALDRASIPWRIAATCHSVEGLRATVIAGFGVSALATSALVPSLALVDDLPTLPPSIIAMFWIEDRTTPAARRLIRSLGNAA
ncbi:MAG: LysR substrate-binding domain-containing protein [Pseudomonadota bacterium]|nr:LysR substrate-binding domain-containing protein [Pseudomonadota bacterium]